MNKTSTQKIKNYFHLNADRLCLIVFTLIISTSSSFAQYKIAPCKASGYKGETCLVKEFQMNEEFYAQDFAGLKKMQKMNPSLPWVQILDSNNSLAGDLKKSANTVPREERGKMLDFLESYKQTGNAYDLLEASEIFLKANPAEKFWISNADKSVMEKFVSALNPSRQNNRPSQESTSPTISTLKCKPNPTKYQALMNDKQRCGGKDIDSHSNELNLYTALAEIASCDRYQIEQVGVVELYRTKGLSMEAPCTISLKGSSASIGGGKIDIKINGEVSSIRWAAGHDLSGSKNTLEFWRNQLGPQVEALSKSPATNPKNNSAEDVHGGQ